MFGDAVQQQITPYLLDHIAEHLLGERNTRLSRPALGIVTSWASVAATSQIDRVAKARTIADTLTIDVEEAHGDGLRSGMDKTKPGARRRGAASGPRLFVSCLIL